MSVAVYAPFNTSLYDGSACNYPVSHNDPSYGGGEATQCTTGWLSVAAGQLAWVGAYPSLNGFANVAFQVTDAGFAASTPIPGGLSKHPLEGWCPDQYTVCNGTCTNAPNLTCIEWITVRSPNFGMAPFALSLLPHVCAFPDCFFVRQSSHS